MRKSAKRLGSFAMLAGLMISIATCKHKAPTLRLTASQQLDHFPSGSGLEYAEGRFYVIGDDAGYLLVLDTAFHVTDSIRYSEDTSYRIDRSRKADYESAAIRGDTLYALSSFSDTPRRYLINFPLPNSRPFSRSEVPMLSEKIAGIEEKNFEGMTFTSSFLVLANRSNLSHPDNYLLLFPQPKSFQELSTPQILKVRFPGERSVKGLSGLFYDDEKDRLYFTASEEETASATEDGKIGESYLGWFDQFSQNKNVEEIMPARLFTLSKVDGRFRGHKIESVCKQQDAKSGTTLVLVADNDNGATTIFRLQLQE